MDNIRINELKIENVKRVKAFSLKPNENGLTIVGGGNRQGKTSVLDAIAWALGGDKYRPSMPQHEGAETPPYLRVELSNGLIVERKGKNSDLKVTDPNGTKSGQQLLNSFIEQLALDLPKFLYSSNKEKAQILLKIIGVGDKLKTLDNEEQKLYQERLTVGRIAEQKRSHAKELVFFPGVPEEPVSAMELLRQQQEILKKNDENRKKKEEIEKLQEKAVLLKEQITELMMQQKQVLSRLETVQREVDTLIDESTEEIEKKIQEVDETNRKVQSNLEKKKADEEAAKYEEDYRDLTGRIEKIRSNKKDLLDNADLPLPDLTVIDGELVYRGQKWDNMSGAEQLIVATSIVRRLNPKCGFVLIDKLEQMDLETLKEFGTWLEREGLQAIATRVSTGDECSIIIQDGCSARKNTD